MATSSPRNVGMNPQYQALYDEEQRKMKLAELLAKQAEGGPMQYLEQPKTMQAAKLPAMAALAPILQQALSGFLGGKANAGMAAAQKSNADEVVSGKAQHALMPDQLKSAQSLMTSANPALAEFGLQERDYQSKIAEKLADREQARLLAGAQVAGKDDPNAAVNWLQKGSMTPGWKAPDLGGPTFGTDPGGNSYALLPQPGRQRDFRYAPKESKTEVNVGGNKDELKPLYAKNADILEKRVENAHTGYNTIANMSRVVQGLEEGAKVGGLGTPLQEARKVLTPLFGIEIPETGITDVVRASLMDAVVQNAKKLAPVTAEDIKRLQQMIGSIDTDPNALPGILAWQTAASMKGIQIARKHRDQMVTGKDPETAQLYEGISTGIDEPIMLTGPMGWKMKVAQELQMMGGDVTDLIAALDPENAGKGPTRFDIRGGGISSRKAIADALAEKNRAGGSLPSGVRRKAR